MREQLRLIVWAFLLLANATSLSAASLERHTVTADGHPLAVWEKSPEHPRAVVLLLHGRTWSTRPDFDLQVSGEDKSLMDGLVARDVVTYGIDLRGYGATPRDGSGWLTPDRAVEDVRVVLEWLVLRHPDASPTLFGWSYGSMVAQLVAQRHGDLLGGVVLFGYPVRPGVDQNPPHADGDPARTATTAAGAASDFIVPGSISQHAINSFVEAALAADPVRADWRKLEQWRALEASQVRVATLIMEGEADPLTIEEVHMALFRELGTTDKAWVVLPGGDHAAFMETPRDQFLDTLAGFAVRQRLRKR